MIHPRQPQTPLPEPEPVDARDGTDAALGRRARRRADPRPAPAELAGPADGNGPVPTWEQARCALFGTGVPAGLVERCRDDESLIAAAHDCHPYLAAYCAHVGRDRLAYAPIHDEDNDRGLAELELLAETYEALAAPWEERRLRGLPLDQCRRGELRKPNYGEALRQARTRAVAASADRRAQETASSVSGGADVAAGDHRSA